MKKLATILLLSALSVATYATCPTVPDTDGDGVVDPLDNCSLVANAPQRDTDGDGFGNICDPDFNNNGVVEALDFLLLKLVFGSAEAPDQDLNGNGFVEAIDFIQLKAFFGKPPGPGRTSDPVACATTEDLQTSNGVLEVPEVGTFAVDWTAMAPGETFQVTLHPTPGVPADFQTASPSFQLVRPPSTPAVSLDLYIEGSGDDLYLARHTPRDEEFPWDISEADQGVSLDWAQAIEDFLYTPLFGTLCRYHAPGIKLNWARHPLDPPCSVEPLEVGKIQTALDEALVAYNYFGCTVSPEYIVYVVTGNMEGTAKANKLYLGKPFFQQLTDLELEAATWHETFHAMHAEALRGTGIEVEKTWLAESLATWGEAKTALYWGKQNTTWVDRYAPWTSSVYERGLNNITRNRDEWYQSAPFLHHLERHAELKVCDLLEQDPYFPVQVLETQVGYLKTHYADYVANLSRYKDNTVTPFASLTGSVTPVESKDLEVATLVTVGHTVTWNNTQAGPLCLEVTPTVGSYPQTRVRISGDNHRQLASVGTSIPGRYPLPMTEPGELVVSTSSIVGVGEGPLVPVIYLQVLRDIEPENCTSTQTPCEWSGPQLFGDFEQALLYDEYCGQLEIDYYDQGNVNINTSGNIIGCSSCPQPPCPTYRSYTVQVGVPKAVQWPVTVAGARTGGALMGGYWPPAFTPGTGASVCDTGAIGVSHSGYEQPSTYQQQVSWTWECEDQEACYGGDGKPPYWGN